MKLIVLLISTAIFIAVIINPFNISSGWSAALTFFVGVFYFSYIKHFYSKFYDCEVERFKKLLGIKKSNKNG